MEKILIHTEYIQLQHLLKWCGAAENGSMAKEIIRDGLVTVNERIETAPGKKIYAGDIIAIDETKYQIELESNASLG